MGADFHLLCFTLLAERVSRRRFDKIYYLNNNTVILYFGIVVSNVLRGTSIKEGLMSDKPIAAKVVCVFNEKGGSGKTTTACQLAGTLGLRGFRVLLADLDPQETASQWLTENGGRGVKAQVWSGHRYGERVIEQVKEFRDKYDVIIADCAPSIENKATWGMLLVADMALIPTRLSPLDMAALPNAKRLARKAREESGLDYPVRVVANAARMHMNDDKALLAILTKDKEFPVLGCTLGERKAYSRSMVMGSSAHAVANGEDAVKEIEALADETLKLLGLTKSARARK